MTRTSVIALSLIVGLGGCATPSLTNLTPSSVSRSPVPLYPLRAQVDGRVNRIAQVNAVIHGIPWAMMALPSDQHAVGYFADTCETNIPYHFSVGYQRRNLLGSGYSSTVREKRFPEAGGYMMNVVGEPPPDDCAASIGLTLRVDSTTDEVDVEPGDGNCRSISNRCTLRAAVMESNVHQGHDLIEVPSGHYALSLAGSETVDVANDAIGDLDITDGLTLMGLGRAMRNEDLQVVIDGGDIDRIFDIYTAAPRAVTLTYLRLENGRPKNSGGGAIWNRGNLRMDRMLLRGNTIDHELESSCAAFPSRRLCNRGAGLFNEGQALIARSTIEQNSTGYESGHAGGISNMGPTAQLYVRDSLITGNDARFWGGLLNYQGTVDILNSTFVDNRSTTGGVRAAEIGNVDGTVSIRNTTFSNHSQLFSHTGTGEFRLANSLVEIRAFNDLPFCSGTLTSGSFNAIGGSSGSYDFFSGCGFVPSTADKTEIRLYLGSLQNNGGPTRTIALREPLEDSPYFDPIDMGGVLCPDTDQRGRPRDDRNCDPGAFEF
ncbi:hypothetical protein NAV33_08885 [Pseudomonas stutzeri]|uniref:choice-of-anchor Q domain-containing protein n=1 Tax=Stutzerimonas stutzeri TaxID=316 RepID=UPI00210EC4A6|nr:choice-of-anchor Q domain-containing protein [Stutzerimonas stutzeri]MCQ4312001.1 hypothetical protein [Stutzerimonas stutzeri]